MNCGKQKQGMNIHLSHLLVYEAILKMGVTITFRDE